MKTNDELIEEFKKRWDKGEDWDYVRDILTQKDSEVAEAVKAENEKHLNALIRIAERIIKQEVSVEEYLIRWKEMLQALTPHPTEDTSDKTK